MFLFIDRGKFTSAYVLNFMKIKLLSDGFQYSYHIKTQSFATSMDLNKLSTPI